MKPNTIIKLISAGSVNPGVDIYLDIEQITYFNISDNGDASYIKLKTSGSINEFLFVKDKPSEIARKIKELSLLISKTKDSIT